MAKAVRMDVAAFLANINAQSAPPFEEMGADMVRVVTRDMVSVLDRPVGELAVLKDFAVPNGQGGAINTRLFDTCSNRAEGPVIVYLHGGGFVFGDLDTHAPLCAEMSRVLDLPVLAVDYRRAPESPWPAAPDDCETVARWVASSPGEIGQDVTGLILAGDSAGGWLAVALSLALQERPATVPSIANALFYPHLDFRSGQDGSFQEFGTGYVVSASTLEWFAKCFNIDIQHPHVAMSTVDLQDMPPTLIVTAGMDPLRDQGRDFAAALARAGRSIHYAEMDGQVHGFLGLAGVLPSAALDINTALRAMKQLVAGVGDRPGDLSQAA